MKLLIKIILMSVFLGLNGSDVLAKDESIGYQVEMLPWDQVNEILPKYSKFTVLDVETGQRFAVQRRAGSHHADVQPLNSEETKIMKDIYGGKWSWKRRAIIVIHNEKWIAASMHGMPHGGGALENNFPGHFCIHFFGSTTHRTNFMDLSHKLMILKAAGKLQDYVKQADPYEVISALIVGLKQQDPFIVTKVSLQDQNWVKQMQQIENAMISRMPVLPVEDLTEEISLEVPLEIEWNLKDSGRQYFSGSIRLVRFSPADAWKIDIEQFMRDNHFETN